MAQFWLAHQSRARARTAIVNPVRGTQDRHVRPEQEKALRRQLDQAIGRALVDHDFAAELISDPAKALDSPALGDVHAWSLLSLARVLLDRFWGVDVGVDPWRQVLGDTVQHGQSSGAVRGRRNALQNAPKHGDRSG